MAPEDHLLEVHKILHMINDRGQLVRLQDQLLALTMNCAHWICTLEPEAAGQGLTAGHLAVTRRERAAAQRELLGSQSLVMLEISLSVKLEPNGGSVTGAVCLSHPHVDVSQFIGHLVAISKPKS